MSMCNRCVKSLRLTEFSLGQHQVKTFSSNSTRLKTNVFA